MTVDLVAERLNRGLTVRAVADKANLSASAVARAEAGKRLHPSSAKALADFYGYKVTDIWPLDNGSKAAA